MYYEVEWAEDDGHSFRRMYKADNLGELWRAIRYMNMERRENGRPVMKQSHIKPMNKYDGEFSDIIGNYDADMALDAEGE